MTVKEFIKALEKCNPNGEIYIEEIAGFHLVTGVIDYTGDNEAYVIESEDFPVGVNK
jgi:hypothetical protein